ncbi:hypothetical protein E2F46_15850 [Luteimonas aestuarii]|uniref:Uncharacterized protein n=1 Tax=Luteimonas aestuarii TaxID=453837 RepID=A0A4R5TRK8_9GAMM|nr:hypothetical protein [Luteimonas aestuarii]TDK20479.1 hypothetical protein E2F46_15850 [Luteimonas aestuarii]
MAEERVGILRLAVKQFFGRVDRFTRGDAFIGVALEDNVWRGSVGKRRTSCAAPYGSGKCPGSSMKGAERQPLIFVTKH